MKKLILFTFAACFMLFAPAQAAAGSTFTGTLIDADCRAANAAAKCEVTEATKSFGLVASDGKFVKLDDAGNIKVDAALKSSSDKPGEKKASITGEMKNDSLSVESVRIL